MNRSIFLVPILIVLLLIGGRSYFVVDERERALVLQFGQIVRVVNEPGLYFKFPWQDAEPYEDRILSLDTEPTQVTPSDDRPLGGGRVCPLPDQRCTPVSGIGARRHQRGRRPSGRYPE